MTVPFLPASLRASGFGIADGAGARVLFVAAMCLRAPPLAQTSCIRKTVAAA